MATKEETEQAGKELNAARRAYADLAREMILACKNGKKVDLEALRKREKELGDEYLKKMDAFFSLLES